MCVSTTALTLISAGVSAYATYQSGQQQKAAMKAQAAIDRRNVEIQNAQLEEEKKLSDIRAWDEEQARREQFNQSAASLKALNRGRDSGSFLAIFDAEEEALKFDIGQVRLGAEIEKGRYSSQISINKVSVAGAGFGADQVGQLATLRAAGTLIGGGAEYGRSRVAPSGPKVSGRKTYTYYGG